MKTLFTKRNIFFLTLVSTLLFSCKKEETLDAYPEQLEDKEHVVLNDMYGITATFPVDKWTNTYMDTMPSDPNTYFDGFRYNAICASLLSDNQQEEEEGDPRYATSIYFMRFHETLKDKEASDKYIKEFKKRMYDDLKGVYYTEIIEHEDTIIGKGDYDATHFTARRGYRAKEGMEDIYLVYKERKQKLYGVLIKIDDDMREASLSKCMEILPTVMIK